ncbi:MAG: hypothetical protein GKC10_05960 [Methanosarcinales archaeon]|nr:hypothetical protein [Methanosarcinales archaeon]
MTGTLRVDPVCDPGVHLTGVDIRLTGTATGPWENAATTINGAWNGGDTDPCDASTIIQNDPAFPTTGTFVVSMIRMDDGRDAVRLVRMPTGYGYIFGPRGSVFSPSEGEAGSAGESGAAADSGEADLKITEIVVPTGMRPGMTADIQAKFINQGSGSAGPFSLFGYAFAADDYQYSLQSEDVPISGLAAGETKTATLTMRIPADAPSGSWDVKVAVDNSNFSDGGAVVETDENNNERWKRDVLGPEEAAPASQGKADLQVTGVGDLPLEATAGAGSITFTMGLKNAGTASANGFYVSFYLSGDRDITIDDIYLGYGVVDLAAGESKSGPVPVQVPADVLPGMYFVGVIANPRGTVDEQDETNNAAASEEQVLILG